MPTTSVQKVSTEDVKQAILALMKENNAEFKQMLGEILPKLIIANTKKKKDNSKNSPILPVQTERIPYSEMPFWKANPDLKPLKLEDNSASKKDFFAQIKALQELFKELDITDEEWLEQIKD